MHQPREQGNSNWHEQAVIHLADSFFESHFIRNRLLDRLLLLGVLLTAVFHKRYEDNPEIIDNVQGVTKKHIMLWNVLYFLHV